MKDRPCLFLSLCMSSQRHIWAHGAFTWFTRLQTIIPAMAMSKPSSNNQYCSRNPGSATLGAGTITAGGLGSGGEAAGAAGITIGAGTITGGGVAALATLLPVLRRPQAVRRRLPERVPVQVWLPVRGIFRRLLQPALARRPGLPPVWLRKPTRPRLKETGLRIQQHWAFLTWRSPRIRLVGMRSGGIFPQLALPGKQLNVAKTVPWKIARHITVTECNKKNKGPNYGPLSHCLLLPGNSGNAGG